MEVYRFTGNFLFCWMYPPSNPTVASVVLLLDFGRLWEIPCNRRPKQRDDVFWGSTFLGTLG